AGGDLFRRAQAAQAGVIFRRRQNGLFQFGERRAKSTGESRLVSGLALPTGRYRTGDEQAAARRAFSEVPGRACSIPRASPAEAVAENQPAGTTHHHVLDYCLELKVLRRFAASITAGQPDIAPDEPRTGPQVDSDSLII